MNRKLPARELICNEPILRTPEMRVTVYSLDYVCDVVILPTEVLSEPRAWLDVLQLFNLYNW